MEEVAYISDTGNGALIVPPHMLPFTAGTLIWVSQAYTSTSSVVTCGHAYISLVVATSLPPQVYALSEDAAFRWEDQSTKATPGYNFTVQGSVVRTLTPVDGIVCSCGVVCVGGVWVMCG